MSDPLERLALWYLKRRNVSYTAVYYTGAIEGLGLDGSRFVNPTAGVHPEADR